MNLTVFHMPGACSRIVLNALEEARLDYADRAVDLFKGQQRTPAMLAVNPSGKVPALQVGGELLTENVAILLYLDETHPSAELLPPTRDPLVRARMLARLVWCSNTLHPLVRTILMPARVSPADPHGARATAQVHFAELLGGVEAQLAQSQWWYGSRWSIADVYLYWCTSTAAVGGLELGRFPAVQAHAKNVRARPSFQRALAREEEAVERCGIQLPPGAQL